MVLNDPAPVRRCKPLSSLHRFIRVDLDLRAVDLFGVTAILVRFVTTDFDRFDDLLPAGLRPPAIEPVTSQISGIPIGPRYPERPDK